MSWLPPLIAWKAICDPSGDQTGLLRAGRPGPRIGRRRPAGSSIVRSPEPSTPIVSMCPFLTKTMDEPSGERLGQHIPEGTSGTTVSVVPSSPTISGRAFVDTAGAGASLGLWWTGLVWPPGICTSARPSVLSFERARLGPNLLRRHAEHLLDLRHPALLPSLGGPDAPSSPGPARWTDARAGCAQPARMGSRAGPRAGEQPAAAARSQAGDGARPRASQHRGTRRVPR